tara:strand:+ start:111 stop:500 length:390 start_codon:yes stop_codon:yes gene_type:complete
MSLSIDVAKVYDWKNYCYIKVQDETTGEEYDEYNPATKYLAWGSMAIGIGEITQLNYKEVYLRHLFMNKLTTRGLVSNIMPVTLEDVRKNIGLKTNVVHEPKGKWLNRISKTLYWELEYNMERENEKEE